MKTIWEKGKSFIKFDTLDSDFACDIAIVGGGIAGLWCAFHLANSGKRVCILEAKTIGSGVTSGSTAIFTYAQDAIYNTLIKKHGLEAAKKYLTDTKNAMKNVKTIIENKKFNCELKTIDFVLFSEKLKGAKALKKEVAAYEKLEEPTPLQLTKCLPYPIKLALQFNDAFQINPLKLCDELAKHVISKGGQIFENTMVKNAPKGNQLKIGNHTITAENFIIATHFPYINLPGFYWLKMYQSQNYTIAFKQNNSSLFCKNISYESIDKTGFEYRKVGDNILCDGVPLRTGKKPYYSKYRIIEKHLNKHFPEYKEITRFCAQDCITMDYLPYAGLYSHFADNVFVVSGFNKWGMTNSYITSDVVSNMIMGKLDKKAKFEENIYTPQRNSILNAPIKSLKNIGVIAASFINKILNLDAKKFNRIENGQGAVIRYKGKRVGASKDENGTIHLIDAVCPHLGCNLKWNKDERTFDCPCHGSRFDTQGNIINNPSTKNCEKFR